VLFLCFSLFFPYLSAHYANHGIDSGRIGILASIGSVVTILILPVWSRISDRTGNRRAVLKVIALGSSLAVLLFIVSDSFWTLFFTVFLFTSFHVCLVPLLDAVVITYLSKTETKFSAIRMGGTLGFALMIFFSGYIYAYNPNFIFILASVFFLVLFFCIRKIPQVIVAQKEKRKLDFRRLFHNKRIIFILFIAFAVQVAQGFFFAFLGVFVQELGYTSREIGIAHFISVIFEVPVLLLIDRVLRRFSVVAVTIFCGFVVTVRMLMLFAATGIGMVYLSMLGNGVSFIGMYYSCATFINKEMAEDLKSTGQSMLAICQMGLGSIVGNTLGGFISQYAGTRFAYLYFGVGLGIVSFICMTVFASINIRRRLLQ
jgi:MFS family permease